MWRIVGLVNIDCFNIRHIGFTRLKYYVIANMLFFMDVLSVDQEPEESPSSSQPCGAGGLQFRAALICVSSGSDWEKRGSAHSGRAESNGAIHGRGSKGSYMYRSS